MIRTLILAMLRGDTATLKRGVRRRLQRSGLLRRLVRTVRGRGGPTGQRGVGRSASRPPSRAHLSDRTQNLKNENEILRSRIARLKDQKHEIDRKLRSRIAQLQQQNQKLSRRIKYFQARHQDSRGQIHSIKMQNEKLLGRIGTLQDKTQELRAFRDKYATVVRDLIKNPQIYVPLINVNVLLKQRLDALEGGPPDLVLCHDFNALYAGALTKRENPNVTAVYDLVEYPRFPQRSYHFYDKLKDDALETGLIRALIGNSLQYYDVILTGNPGQDAALREDFGDLSTQIVLNARPYETPPQDTSIRSKCGVSDSDVLILHPNSVVEASRLDDVLAGLGQLGPGYHMCLHSRLRLDQHRAFINLARVYGVDARVHTLQPVDPSRIIQEIAGADVAVLPMDTELENYRTALPNRLFEVMSARVPVVANESTAIGEFVRHHDIGETYADRDIGSFVAAIRRTQTRTDLPANLENAVRQVSWDHIKQQVSRKIPFDRMGSGRCVVLAGKKIETNSRIHRYTKLLRDHDCEVTVLAFDKPVRSLQVPGVRYVAVGPNVTEAASVDA